MPFLPAPALSFATAFPGGRIFLRESAHRARSLKRRRGFPRPLVGTGWTGVLRCAAVSFARGAVPRRGVVAG